MGSIPRLSALAQSGTLASLVDAVGASGPADLATIATGARPERHGIWRWDEAWGGGGRPITRTSWQAAPVWARLDAAGVTSASVGWPGARPGAEWEGWHVDEDFAPTSGRWPEDWALPRRCAPPSAREGLRARRVHVTDVSAAMLRPFVPTLDALDQTRDTHLPAIASRLAAAATMLGASAWMFEEASPAPNAILVHLPFLGRLRAVYEGAAAPFDHVVEAAWRFVDGMIGRLVELAGPDALTLVAGMGWRGAGGVLIAAGGGEPARARPAAARLIDVAPTMLSAFGLADPELPGRVVLPGLARGPMRPAPRPAMPGPAPPDEDLLIVAEAAGFRRPPAPPAAWSAQRLAELAALLVAYSPARAAATAQAALDLDADNLLALAMRVRGHLTEGELAAVPPLAERLRRLAPTRGWGPLAEAALYIARGDPDGAIPRLKEAEPDLDPTLRVTLAMVWLAAGEPAEAERLLRQTLAARPEDRGARLGLALATADGGDLAAAERELRALLSEDPALAPAQLELARVLARAGRGGEAELAAQAARALGASPSAVQAARRGRRG